MEGKVDLPCPKVVTKRVSCLQRVEIRVMMREVGISQGLS